MNTNPFKQQIKDYDEINNAWLELTAADIKNATWNDPLAISPQDREYFGLTPLRVMKNPSANYLSYAAKTLLNVDLLPIQSAILSEMWNKPFPMLIGSRGLGKTTLLAFYAMLKMSLTPPNSSGGPGCKIIITGAGFRQSKQVFEYMEQVWYNAPILRNLCKNIANQGVFKQNDRYTLNVGSNFTIAIPIGNGEKVRGLRANIVLADEFNSLDPVIFETIVQGFAAVSANPIDAVKAKAAHIKALEMGLDVGQLSKDSNQIIISGTCGYDFEHFAAYWKRYKTIITSRGDDEKLGEMFPDGIPEGFNWRDYSVIRIPFNLVPKGFLDEKILIRAKATVHSGTFGREYGAVFSKDSTGFFKRTLIESAVASEKNINKDGWPLWCPVSFDVKLSGDSDKKYIIAVDPASEVDNFSVIIVELHPQHARVVYGWTTNKKRHRELVQGGFTQENDFYAYCARKIRTLMAAFPCDHIVLDAQGGGVAVTEALHNRNNLGANDIPIWPIANPEKPSPTDYESGLHIIELVQFANYEWVSEANHGLRLDLESKTLLLPRFDAVTIALAGEKDIARLAEHEKANPTMKARPFDTLEDAVFEIEELKDELTSIVLSRTGIGSQSRDRWDTPEVKTQSGKKGRMRKDRYSSLVMANMAARKKRTEVAVLESINYGGLLSEAKGSEGNFYEHGPDDYKKGMESFMNEVGNIR